MNKRLIKNSAVSLLQQIVTIVAGLILSRSMLYAFGSEINGLNASINQFLCIIALLEGGIGTVARVTFYKPLAENNHEELCSAYYSISDFYRRISFAFMIYLVSVSALYPLLKNTGYDYWFVFALAFLIGVSSVFEYSLGQVNQILLFSDQQGYRYSFIQILFCIIRTLVAIILINHGYSVIIVRLGCALVYVIRPILLSKYVKRKYNITDTKKEQRALSLGQKSAALARHIAQYIHTSTDIILLTFFSDLLAVSVYSVYYYVINCLSVMVTSIMSNSEALFGELVSLRKYDELVHNLRRIDFIYKMLACVVFSVSVVLTPYFIMIYTKGMGDVDYYQPLFAFLLVLAEMINCMGLIYQNVYVAAGYIKKTQYIAVTEAVVNLVISIALVNKFGIMGVAVGTLCSVIVKTILDIHFLMRIIDISIKHIAELYASAIAFCILSFTISHIYPCDVTSFGKLLLFGIFVTMLVMICVFIYCVIFFRFELKEIYYKAKRQLPCGR